MSVFPEQNEAPREPTGLNGIKFESEKTGVGSEQKMTLRYNFVIRPLPQKSFMSSTDALWIFRPFFFPPIFIFEGQVMQESETPPV